MPLYTYHVINHNGETETGTYQADSVGEVARELKSRVPLYSRNPRSRYEPFFFKDVLKPTSPHWNG
jgi:type II secretory pathway component PulF